MPPWDDATFSALVQDLVDVNAPRVFALVQRDADGMDARVAAWGMEFAECAYAVAVGGVAQVATDSASSAVRYFGDVGVVWVSPAASSRRASAPASGRTSLPGS